MKAFDGIIGLFHSKKEHGMSGIVKDEKEFFRTVLESLRVTDSEYCEEHGSFDGIPADEWESILDEYVSDVL